MKKILIVEDEKQLSDIMCLYLKKEGYHCTSAYDGNTAQTLLEEETFDLVILDIMMPGKDGWSVLRKLRMESSIPVIITTARGEEDDRIFGLELGADDYMSKPLSMRELVLRVKLRITSKRDESSESNVLSLSGMSIHKDDHSVTWNDSEVSLTPKEFTLLLFLCENRNMVFSRDKLLDQVWGYDFYGDTRTVDTHVKKLREKLPICRDSLKTVWKVGYKFEWRDSHE